MDEQDLIQKAREKIMEIEARARSNTHRLDGLEAWKDEAERKHDEYGQRITKTCLLYTSSPPTSRCHRRGADW